MPSKEAILISYAKSGRTWLLCMLRLMGIEVFAAHLGGGTGGPSTGRHFRTLRFEVPPAFQKVLFLHRDPLDTVVSNYWQMHKRELPHRPVSRRLSMKTLGRYPPRSIDEFALSPRYGVEKICVYNLGWVEHLRRRRDAKISSYEGLTSNPATEIRKVGEFLQPGRSFDAVDVAKRSSFDEMQRRERSTRNSEGLSNEDDLGDPESLKVRRGKVGGYVDYLHPRTIEQARAVMARLSYEERTKDGSS